MYFFLSASTFQSTDIDALCDIWRRTNRKKEAVAETNRHSPLVDTKKNSIAMFVRAMATTVDSNYPQPIHSKWNSISSWSPSHLASNVGERKVHWVCTRRCLCFSSFGPNECVIIRARGVAWPLAHSPCLCYFWFSFLPSSFRFFSILVLRVLQNHFLLLLFFSRSPQMFSGYLFSG